MDITNVRIKRIRTNDTLRAFASVTFDDCFVIHGIKVISGSDGYFITMPNRKTRDGVQLDQAHPITNDFRLEMQKAVLIAYESALNSEADHTVRTIS